MTYPCYCAINQSDYNYVRASLDSFGYNVNIMSKEYLKVWNCIVLDSDGKFGVCNNLPNEKCIIEKRTPTADVEIFLNEAKKLLKDEKKQTQSGVVSIEEIKMENNKPQTKELKVGDMVFVRDNHTEKFKRRIYIGKIHEKYACVTNTTEKSYNDKTDFSVKLWSEIATEIIITKKEIADKFDYPIEFIKIVD